MNPAVTLGLAFNGDFPWSDVPEYILAQMIGAIIGAAIIYLHFLPHWHATKDPGVKLGVFATGPAIPHYFSNLLSEIIGTFVLVVGLLINRGEYIYRGIKSIHRRIPDHRDRNFTRRYNWICD